MSGVGDDGTPNCQADQQEKLRNFELKEQVDFGGGYMHTICSIHIFIWGC